MDGRFIVAAVVLVAAAAVWQVLLHTHSAFAWSIPFAVILLFLAAVGHSPSHKVVEWIGDDPIR